MEGLGVASTLQVLLDYDAEVEIWNQGTFEPGGTTLESLVRSARTFDFAVLIVTPDDTIQSRGGTRNITRDNVLFELGLFMGALGKERVYMLYDRNNRPDLPSDLAGVTPVTYSLHRNGNLRASLGAASTQLKEVFKRLGLRQAQTTEDELSQPSPTASDRSPTGVDADQLLQQLEPKQDRKLPAKASSRSAAQPVSPSTVSETEMDEAEEMVRKKRRSYSSASSFYRDFENGRWLEKFSLSPSFESAAARKQLKDRWIREADLTQSWDHSNIVFMQLELVADQLTVEDVDQVLELPTKDAQGHDQEAGLWAFLEFLERAYPSLLSEKAQERLAEFKMK
jgi:hypothetical protein